MGRKKQRKFNPRPKIDYPPLTLRKWVPPDLRPKKKRKPKYVKPPGISQKLAISSLGKIWHQFRIVNNRTFLLGHYSETHKRFRKRSNGYQTPCNCVMAIAFSSLYEMAKWHSYVIDTILNMGDQLYYTSVQQSGDRTKTCLKLSDVYNSFYHYGVKYTMNMKYTTYQGKLFEDFEESPFLANVIKDFFNDKHTRGIITTQEKHLAFWTDGKSYYLFSSTDHDQYACSWKGIPGRGFACVMRFKDTDCLVNVIHENVDLTLNSRFVITPCYIIRTVTLDTVPPDNIPITHCDNTTDLEEKEKPRDPCAGEKKEPVVVEEEEEMVDVIETSGDFEPVEEADEYSPDAADVPASSPPACKIPHESAKAESITHFATVVDGLIGILRASTFQGDTRFSPYKGKQSLANAMAALTMLRLYKSKYWFRRILDEILLLGEDIHKATLKSLKGRTLKVTTLSKKIFLQDKIFTPDVEEFTIAGKLQSLKDDLVDLLPALQEFFRDHDAGIITGPVNLAIWKQDGVYYMFDPNERDHNGLAILKSLQVGSELRVLDYTPGVACLMWFRNLKDLTKIYLNNVEKGFKFEPFVVSRVQIDDYVELPSDWSNFKGVADGKWILRGTFNQNDRRFDKDSRNTQCTAVAVLALAYFKVKPVKRWSTDDVDEILIQGDNYYKNCIEALQENNKFIDKKLLVDECLRRFPLERVQMNLEIQDCLVNGLLDAKDDNDAYNLKKGLEYFFKDNDTCIVTTRSISVAVWKSEEVYYYYDSHSRDEKGVINNFGTSCVLRVLNVADLAKAIETNLSPGVNNIFNISKIVSSIWELTDEGIVRPPLNNFTELGTTAAILRSLYHERSLEYKLNIGKQTIPMCYAAAGMIKLYPSSIWSRDILDEILNIGDKLYTDTMVQREKTPDLPEEDDIDEVYAENCLMDFNIGINKFSLRYDSPMEGNFENDFKICMESFLNQASADENDQKELLVASDVYTVMTWTDQGLFYLFDPKPRDEGGQVIGKEEWSQKVDILGEEEGESFDLLLTSHKGGGDAGEDDEQKQVDTTQALEPLEEDIKHSPEYWRSQEEIDGKACTMWFVTMDKFIEHIVENTPPTKREEIMFKLYPITITNKPEVKRVFDADEFGEPEDYYSGDWHEFKEIDHGRWILRGTMSHTHEMFPPHNRGRQSIAMAFTALAYVRRFAVSTFKAITVDDILKYGDRLLSATRKSQHNKLKLIKDLGLTDDDIDARLNRINWGVSEISKKFCIGLDQMQMDISPDAIKGDLNAQESEELYDIKRGLEAYFEENRAGIIEAKDLVVAVWKGLNIYFMFDPGSRGPNGIQCVSGRACITRYLDLNVLVDVFLKNVDKTGKNVFAIHQVKIRIVPCPREPKPEEIERVEIRPKYNGYNMVMPGKCILRGSLSQDDPVFGRGRNAQSAPIAIVALTMTLIHKASTWTKPIIDEILIIGDELYATTLDTLGFQFNPWEQGMTAHLVNKDYKMGTIKANCELRTMDQRGIIDIKHPKILNIRQGIENFFKENTHGIIETETLTVAIWEEEEQPNIIYMYDPNPRGPAGLPFTGGSACVLTFESAKMAADHFIANVTDKTKRSGEFVVIPVEIVVGDMKTKVKEVEPCCYSKEASIKTATSPTQKEKKKLRDMAAHERSKKEAARIAQIGKCEYFVMKSGDAILRGSRSQTWKGYTSTSRGNQDIPNCLTAFVIHRLIAVPNWHYKHIDLILDIGDQLYKDSYITYDPRDPKLGFKNVLRNIFIKDVEVSLRVYLPVLSNVLTEFNLEMALVNYFQQEAFGILSANNQHVALFFKEGYYYMFDPHDRDIEGNSCASGCACVLKFQTLPNLVAKYISNVVTIIDSIKNFSITLVTIGSISRSGVIDIA